MSVLPVATRELLVQARRKSTYWIRLAASTVAGFLMLWLLVVGGASVPTMSQGKTLFTILSVLAFVYCLMIGAFVTADSLSAEKRDGTLGLLFLTDLKGYDVVFGKLVSSSLHAVYGLLGVVPMMSMTLLFGGVTGGEIARTALVLGNTLFLSLAAGMFVSTLSQNDRKAVFGAVLLILIVSAGPYELGYFLASNYARGTAFNVVETVLSPSPIFAFTLAQSAPVAGVRPSALYSSLAQTHAIAWVLLALSCGIVPHVCKDRPKGRRGARWSAWRRRWRFGKSAERASFRSRLLDRNPCYWLSSRARYKSASVWVLIVPLAAIGLWIYIKYSVAFYETSIFLLLTIQVLLKVWFAGETCHRWIEDRQSGALELLLSAPLQTKEIVQGQELALRRQFAWPVAATVGLTIVAWFTILRFYGGGSSTQFGRVWLLMSIPVLIADLVALRWVGMWLGLTARGLNRAIAGALVRVLCLRWLIYLFIVGCTLAWSWLGFRRTTYLTGPSFWLVSAVALDFILALSARRKFLAHFRMIAANPLDYRSVMQKSAVEAASGQDVKARSDGEEGTPARRKRWMSNRRREWVLATVAILLLAVGLPLDYRYSLKGKVDRRLKTLQQAGFPMATDALDQWRRPMTNAVNAADVLERAFPALVFLPRFPQWIQQNLPGYRAGLPYDQVPLTKTMKDALVSVLSSNREALTIVHAAASLRMGRYAMDWNSPGGRHSAQSQGFWMVSQLLQSETILRAENGDVQGALDSLHRLIDLGCSLDREPALVFQQMRTACFAKAFLVLQWLLNRHALADSELKALQKELSDAESRTDLQGALIGLRCLAVEWYHSPVPGPRPPGMMEQFRIQLQNRMRALTGANDRDFLAFLDAMDEFTRIVQAPWPDRFQRARRLGVERRGGSQDVNSPRPFSSKRVFDYLISPNAEFVARCRAASTSLAIERFRLHHAGPPPERLAELVPEFISAAPSDPFDGQPIRYQSMPAGYRIYSIGKNRQDDVAAAQAALQNQKGRPRLTSDDITFSVLK